MPIAVFGFGVYLAAIGDRHYSIGIVLISFFMWLLVLGNEVKLKNQEYGTDSER
jgi:hypothetical protein